ncbi:hypothetical protein DPEC_G00206730 [Dallia pectoralis]|uniref:Uncharacterized protein n=1 Tax=Dallia pectoralis TaxID=75939 RepID=A0ACC2G534_DALPE|nr:hypothetical protein DPEC_G00206730 [Dallia pectoralis]
MFLGGYGGGHKIWSTYCQGNWRTWTTSCPWDSTCGGSVESPEYQMAAPACPTTPQEAKAEVLCSPLILCCFGGGDTSCSYALSCVGGGATFFSSVSS